MKSFKKNNPLENLDNAPKKPEIIKVEEQGTTAMPETREETSRKKEGTGEKKYLRLDITEYQEYVSLMSQYASKTSGKHVSMTQYILRLIEADRQDKKDIYDKLIQIEQMKNEII